MPAALLTIPRELRDKIYAYLLVDEDAVYPNDNDKRRYPGVSDKTDSCVNSMGVLQSISIRLDLPPHPLSSQFLRTNKQIYAEAKEILYSRNRFDIHDSCPRLFEIVGPDNARLIRHVRMQFPGLTGADADKSEEERSDDVSCFEKDRGSHADACTHLGDDACKDLNLKALAMDEDSEGYARQIKRHCGLLRSIVLRRGIRQSIVLRAYEMDRLKNSGRKGFSQDAGKVVAEAYDIIAEFLAPLAQDPNKLAVRVEVEEMHAKRFGNEIVLGELERRGWEFSVFPHF